MTKESGSHRNPRETLLTNGQSTLDGENKSFSKIFNYLESLSPPTKEKKSVIERTFECAAISPLNVKKLISINFDDFVSETFSSYPRGRRNSFFFSIIFRLVS